MLEHEQQQHFDSLVTVLFLSKIGTKTTKYNYKPFFAHQEREYSFAGTSSIFTLQSNTT